MRHDPLIAGTLSLFIPGMGQIYAGSSGRGAAILVAVILVGNLNAIWLSLYGLTVPVANAPWLYEVPRILHDVFAFYGITFWSWQVLDAYQQTKNRTKTNRSNE
jgi:TM2 domain-containing membrane protein YozV